MTRLDEIKQAFEQRGYLCNDESEFLLTSLTEMETQLHLEQKSVNELSLTLQDTEERMREVMKERDAIYFDMVKYLERAEQAEARIKELGSELKLNASMLAKQCDLARNAETNLTKLCEAVDRHRRSMHVYIPQDKELYCIRDEVEKEAK